MDFRSQRRMQFWRKFKLLGEELDAHVFSTLQAEIDTHIWALWQLSLKLYLDPAILAINFMAFLVRADTVKVEFLGNSAFL